MANDPATNPVNDRVPAPQTGVHVPYRKVVATTPEGTDLPFDGVDVDVTVTHRGRGPPTWTVHAYDLAPRVWDALQDDTRITITVGWRNGPKVRAIRGPVHVRRPNASAVGGGDPRHNRVRGSPSYLLRGVSQAGARLGKRVARTWRDATPQTIVRDIARMANLGVGHVPPHDDPHVDTVPFEANWTITSTRPLKQWLDTLVRDIARQTDREWTWYTHATDLYVVPRGMPTGDPVSLARTTTDARYPAQQSADEFTSGDVASRSFSRALDPAVRRGRAVQVAQTGTEELPNEATTYVVGGYQFESSSRTGRHYVHGTLRPRRRGVGYTPVFPESSADPEVAPEEPDG